MYWKEYNTLSHVRMRASQVQGMPGFKGFFPSLPQQNDNVMLELLFR